MCDYDCGFECEEKHLEDMELSEEFYEQIDELIAEESKKYIKKQIDSCNEAVKRQHKKIDDLTTENNEKYALIEELGNKIKNLELQLSGKEKQIEELDIKIKFLGNEFLINETVFYIDHKYIRPTCPECNGNKKVEASYKGVKTDIDCQKCGGFGTLEGYNQYFAMESKIKAIQFDENSIKYAIYGKPYDWTFRNKNKFFKTLEEAETECEKLNKKEKKGE